MERDPHVPVGRRPIDHRMFLIGAQLLLAEATAAHEARAEAPDPPAGRVPEVA